MGRLQGGSLKFNSTDTNENYSIFRWESEGGEWEMGVYPVTYGARVSLGRVGSISYLKGGYCVGNDMLKALQVVSMLQSFLSVQPEQSTENEISRLLPDWDLRPIGYPGDKCWEQLMALAVTSTSSNSYDQPELSTNA